MLICWMQVSPAASAFGEGEGCPFVFMHCWDLMKDEPKWQPTKHNAVAQQISSRVPVDPFAPPASSFVGDGSPFATTSSGKRPLGRDATKAKHKKIASSSASSADAEFVANLHELNITKTSQWNQEFNRGTTRDDSLFQLKQDHLELEKKKVAM
jgi:hypothetical protein